MTGGFRHPEDEKSPPARCTRPTYTDEHRFRHLPNRQIGPIAIFSRHVGRGKRLCESVANSIGELHAPLLMMILPRKGLLSGPLAPNPVLFQSCPSAALGSVVCC
jgi:hypothetical protein